MSVFITKDFESKISKIIPLCNEDQLKYLMPLLINIREKSILDNYYMIMLTPINKEGSIYKLNNHYNLDILICLRNKDYFFIDIGLED